jgi:outer membrane protein OmpA-like peptidoglycan-associated protein
MERARQIILARRQRLIAAALGLVGGAACAPQSVGRARPETGSSSSVQASSGARTASRTNARGQEADRVTPSPDAGRAEEPPPAGGFDTDGDGVPDARDACPDQPGADAPDSLRAGCPPRPCLTILPPGEIEFRARIAFERGRSTLPAHSIGVLDEMARVLADHDEMELEIIGHTDSTEPEDLALMRARSVRDALVTRGVAPSRLELSGQGARSPSAPNSTAEGRAQNRRVEFLRRGPRTPLDR